MPIAHKNNQIKNAPAALEAFAWSVEHIRHAFFQLAQFLDTEARERQSYERGE